MPQQAQEHTANRDLVPESVRLGTSAERPVELELGDGSRLVLDSAEASPIVCRLEGMQDEKISLEDVLRLEGQPFEGFRLLR